jgi:hypothetical protein
MVDVGEISAVIVAAACVLGSYFTSEYAFYCCDSVVRLK